MHPPTKPLSARYSKKRKHTQLMIQYQNIQLIHSLILKITANFNEDVNTVTLLQFIVETAL